MIIIDLAKKWIFAENTYFSASRRGSYSPIGLGAQKFAYEFSEKWHFVAEAKWFNYLFSCDLQPFFKRGMNDTGVIGAGAISQPVSLGESGGGEPERHWEDQLEALEAMPEDIEEEEEMWDDERAGIEVEYINRVTMLIYFEPQNAAEERDLQTLEHIIRYEQKAAVCEHQIQQARQEISALQIELQAAENLRNRTAEPRWERKCIHFQTLIGQQEKHIANLMCKQDEAAAMAAELRTLGSSEKYQETLKSWQDED